MGNLGPNQDRSTSFLSTDAGHALVAAARSGDPDAMEALVQAALDYVFPVILSLLHNRRARGTYVSDTLQGSGELGSNSIEDDAWDLTHHTCLAMLKGLPTFKGRSRLGQPVQFTTWLYAIAQNQVRATMRQRFRELKRRHRTVSPTHHAPVPEPADATSPGPEERFIERAEVALVEEGLREAPLTPEQRDAVIMFYVMGYRQERIAQLTGVQVGTVKKRIFDGIKKLRRYVEEAEGTKVKAGGM